MTYLVRLHFPDGDTAVWETTSSSEWQKVIAVSHHRLRKGEIVSYSVEMESA